LLKIRKKNPINCKIITIVSNFYQTKFGYTLPTLNVTIRPIIQTKAVCETSEIALATAFMFFVIVTPNGLYAVTLNIQQKVINKRSQLFKI
jgi:hypothetical protein